MNGPSSKFHKPPAPLSAEGERYSIEDVFLSIPVSDLARSLEFYKEKQGFRLLMIRPADDPREAVIEKGGARVRLFKASPDQVKQGPVLEFESPDKSSNIQYDPDGLPIAYLPKEDFPDSFEAGPQKFQFMRATPEGWHQGRAGMEYRDLIPDRLNGHYIASHIHVKDHTSLADQPHFHPIRYQMIYCLAGEASVSYQDQGPDIVFKAGDCLLQPPGIIHRVNACSDGFQVLEICSPADHATWIADESMFNTKKKSKKTYGDQYFCHSQATKAQWQESENHSKRSFGFGKATKSDFDPVILRFHQKSYEISPVPYNRFFFLLKGGLDLDYPGHPVLSFQAHDCYVIPAHQPARLTHIAPHAELIEVPLI